VIGRGVLVAGVLTAGSALTAALYWAFLNTPESNVLMLGVSVLLVLTIVIIVAITVNAAILVARGASTRDALAAGARGAGWFVIAVTPLVLAWIAIGRFDRWVIEHNGEIHAWFIARFGWADISRLMQFEMWVSRWLRWAVLPVTALSLLTALLTLASSGREGWLRRAWHWRTLLVTTLVFVLLFALPWQLTNWRPSLPPTWVTPAVAAVRLGIALVLGFAGATVLVATAARIRPQGPGARPQASGLRRQSGS
jgi:hypothetical protein